MQNNAAVTEVREHLSADVNSFFELVREVQLPTRSSGSPILTFDGANPAAEEQYRIVRVRLRDHPAKPRKVAISSPEIGDGKTVNAINLSAVLALRENVRVLLIDGDMRRSSVAQTLGIPPAPGFAEVLARTASIGEAIVRVSSMPGLFIIAAGKRPSNPAELLDSRLMDLLKELERYFDYVIADTPPVGAVADSNLIHNAMDGLLLIVRPGHTNRALLSHALQAAGPKLLGVIENCHSDWFLLRRRNHAYPYHYSEKSKVNP